MRKLLIALCAVALVMTACQKEPSYEDPTRNPGGAGGGNNGTKLVRIGARFGDDTLTIDYGYNGSDRLTLLTYLGTSDGEPIDLQQIINRNTANVIASTVLKSPAFLQAGFDTDSIVITYEYDAASGQYLRGVSHYILDNENLADSVVYNYDASGKLGSLVFYAGDDTGYEPYIKTEYTYAGNNLASKKLYLSDGSGFVLQQTETYEYDTKTNPLQSAADAPVLGTLAYFANLPLLDMLYYHSANNLAKVTVVTDNPQQTYTGTITYSYNASDRPARADGTSGSSAYTFSYYYQ